MMNNANLYCRQKAAHSGSSFYYSFRFLPSIQQQAIIAVYAFCREVDDIVDECSDKDVARQKLVWWSSEIERTYAGRPEHPVGQALSEALTHFQLQKSLFDEIIQGMAMDLSYQGYQTFDDLRLYCHCVASTVGLLAAEIFGYQNSRTLEYARSLGIAFQLVNIIRDIGEDARRARVYLPEDELARFSLTPQNILNKEYSENFKALMAFQAQRAREYYQKALLALPIGDRYTQRSGLIMAEIYFALLNEIEKLNYRVFHQRVSLTPLRKLWIAWKTARRIKPISDCKQYLENI